MLTEIGEVTGRWLSFLDGEEHQRLRRLAHHAFTPRAVGLMEQRIQEIADGLLDPHGESGEIELVHDFAFQLPLMVICEMLDIPAEDRFRIREWTVGLASFTEWGVDFAERDDRLRYAHSCARSLYDHISGVMEDRRGKPTTSLLGNLLAADEDGDRFQTRELVGMLTQVVRAGHETTTNLIAVGTYNLLKHPDQWRLLCERPELVSNAVEELLRFRSPTQKNERRALVDTVLGGVEIHAGDRMGLFLGSANRDPDRFPDPDRLDIARADVKHIGFGWGAHHCLGSALNRLESSVAFRTLSRRFPDLAIAEREVSWRRLWTFSGLESLPLTLGKDRG